VDHAEHVRAICDVRADRCDPPEFLRRLLGCVRVYVVDDHLRTFTRQTDGYRSADTAASPCYQRHTTL
jgi:hypothetical protein